MKRPIVVAALDKAQQGSGKTALPPQTDDTETLTARIYAAALGPEGGAAARLAVVRLDKTLLRGYAMLFWGTPRD